MARRRESERQLQNKDVVLPEVGHAFIFFELAERSPTGRAEEAERQESLLQAMPARAQLVGDVRCLQGVEASDT